MQRAHEAAEEDYHVKVVGLTSQGVRMEWDQALEQTLPWKEHWASRGYTLYYFGLLLTFY